MKIFIAGGGSGGHIYPALSIAKALKEKDANLQVEFVGTKSGLETKIVPREGEKLRLIQSGKLNYSGNILQKIKSLIQIPMGILQSFFIIMKERPAFVLGVGGYASAPFTLAASLLGVKTAIWEPNAHPGMANRILSKYVNKAYLVFADGTKFLKTKNNEVLGMPLRYKPETFMLDKNRSDKFTILCFGGSQGSQFLNEKISDFLIRNPKFQSQLHVIHQTGPKDFERVKAKYAQSLQDKSCVDVFDYIYDMPNYYVKADLLFCRGGASTLAEAALFGVVPVVVPLPAADNHQQSNAESLVKAHAGYMILQNEFDMEQFKALVQELMANRDKLNAMSQSLKKTVPAGAAQKIAEDILRLISK